MGYGVRSGHLRNFDAEDNEAFSASLTDRRFFRPGPSIEQKVHEESARQKSDSRNQEPANPIPQNSGCHNTKIDWSSYDPFDHEAYRKHQEKRRSKREHGKNAGKKHGSQQTTAPSRKVGSQSPKEWK